MSAGIHAARIVIDASGAPVRDERLASLLSATQALARVAEGRVAVSPLAARIVRSAFSVEEPTGDRGGSGALFVSAAPSAATVYGRFIGRVDELKRLGDILASATRRRGQLVVVQGDKGIGKSRVVAEMDRRLAKGNYNVGFYVAACPRNGAGVPWSGLRAMLGVLCGVQEGDDEQRILDVLPRLRALGLQLDESSVVLAQLGAATPDLPAQAPQEVAAILRSAFARMVQSLADDRLHVLAWDDAHAMDPQTLDLLLATLTRFHGRSGETGAASSGAGLRTVFLLATRENPPEALTQGVAAWEGNARAPLFHRITLQELGEEDCARLLASRVGARILGPELVAFCRERAGGHPLFLEELVKELVDSGAVSVQNGLVKARLEGATTVPRTLRTLIAGRVSRLDPEARALLAAAAILGDPLSTRVLGALLSASTAHVDRVIAGLVARDLLRVIGPEQIAFASPMHEEIVLDSVPPEARRELHAAAAAARIEITGEGNEQAERIAHHLHEAGDRDRSATWYARAAQAKLRARQIEPAIRFFGRALDLCDLDARAADDLSDWLHQLAGAATRSRVAPDFVHLATRALRRVDDTGSLDQQVLSRVDAAMACGAINEFDDANRWLEEAYMLADVRGELRLRALSVETEMAARAGDFARAKRAADEAAAMGPITSGRLLLNLAHALAAAGSIEPAIAALDRAEALDAPEDLEAATDRAKARVLVYIYGRDAAKGLDASRHAVELARATGLRFPLASCLHNLGDAARRVGDFPRAHAALSESRDVALASGNERLATLNRMHLAYLDGVTGEAGAVSLLREFLRYAESRSYWTDALECRLLLGQLLVRRGSLDEARVELERLLELASVRGNHLIVDDARDALRDCEAASK
jgi:tetratricopeptide (TPR) repeat protein